jgi:hypothetical protein
MDVGPWTTGGEKLGKIASCMRLSDEDVLYFAVIESWKKCKYTKVEYLIT